MNKEHVGRRKYCGNCSHHSTYNYPHQIFCTLRFSKREKPIVSTLDVCESWSANYQECFCVQKALEKRAVGQPSEKGSVNSIKP